MNLWRSTENTNIKQVKKEVQEKYIESIYLIFFKYNFKAVLYFSHIIYLSLQLFFI